MKTVEYRTVDKSGWATGPWRDEPDKKQWLDGATGLPCLIVRSPIGSLCGYVGLPAGHDLHGKDYDSVDVDVHGGLTFAGRCHHAPDQEQWRKFREAALAGAKEAERFPRGDAAELLRERAKEIESYEAYALWVRAATICHTVEPGEADDVWWLGFDCAHAGDLSPKYASLMAEIAIERGALPRQRNETYRDLAFVTRECERLAAQIKSAAT